MQQTQNYKLNLIGTSDAFSPNPLNENAEKTEAALSAMGGAVAQCQEENCLVKLFGPWVAAASREGLTIDLSGMELEQYAALFLFSTGWGSVANTLLYFNEETSNSFTLMSMNGTRNMTIAWFMPVDQYVLAMAQGMVAGSSSTAPQYCMRIPCTWEELRTFRIVGGHQAGAMFVLYGLKK